LRSKTDPVEFPADFVDTNIIKEVEHLYLNENPETERI